MKEQDGIVRFLPHRGVYVGYWNGKIQCTKKTPQACKDFLNAKFGVLGIAPKVVAPKVCAVNLNGTQHTLLTQVADEWTKAKAVFSSIKDIPTPSVEFYTRGKIAGKAWKFGNRVAFNTVLAAENPNEFLNTVKHELAHLVVNKIFPFAKAHGPEFKRCLIALGGNGKRCHNYDVSNVAPKRMKYEYKCACQTHAMSTVKHRKAQMGCTYTCRKCRTKVAYTGKTVMA